MSSGNSVNLDSEDVEIIEQSKSPINHEELRKIEAWLEPTDYLNDFSEFNRHIASRAPETGIWYVKTLMTSRPVQQLQLKLEDASIVHISLEDDQVRKDIDLFVSRRLESMFERNNPDTQLSLRSIICDRSAGLFLCARLFLESLMPALVSKQHLDSEDIASTLPVGMQEMFNSILLQQSKSIGIDTNLQQFILNAVIFSSRLLRLNEIADLFAFVYPSYHLSSAKTIVKSACVSAFSDPEDIDFRRWLTLDWGIRFITKDSLVPSPGHVAAFSGMSSCLKLLLSKTEDINSKDPGGRTLLHWACQPGHLRIFELLLHCVYRGTTMLYAATMGGNPSCVEQILIRDADPNAFSGPRMLDRRQHSAKPQDRKHFQSTALHVLAESWSDNNLVHAREQILNLLIKYGANLEAKDRNGHTPLWLFTTRDTDSFDTTIQFLARNGARCDVHPVKRLSIIERVANSKNYSIGTFKVMLQYYTDMETKRRSQQSFTRLPRPFGQGEKFVGSVSRDALLKLPIMESAKLAVRLLQVPRASKFALPRIQDALPIRWLSSRKRPWRIFGFGSELRSTWRTQYTCRTRKRMLVPTVLVDRLIDSE
ncbi:uncharacterized protein EAE98_007737 [Botrytis deweyae]|uniref:Ankyrin n=1 Tax=Botrytis deweyae TaxID=2478750 RepID=A0ABQ7IFU7_9HELO|nr:uncharacterized protein EAE98_007737 [Botrytis deweyae]KAF7923032.1 hypothetical protein EAE98_007737 [Botrytis deweyae]